MSVTFTIPGKPEVWTPVVGYEGRYEVSSLGRVRSILRKVTRKDGFTQTHGGKILRQNIGSHGYPGVALCNGGTRGKTKTVHSLVAAAFIGPRPQGCEVRHLNGNRADPRLCNLEYATNQQNQRDRRKHGTHNFGERNPSAKLTAAKVNTIRALHAGGNTPAQLARRFAVADATIRDILKGKTWAR